MGLAAETFNDGLRGYYLSFAVVAWFFSTWAFMIGTLLVLWVLIQSQAHREPWEKTNLKKNKILTPGKPL